MLNALDGEFARAGHTTTIKEFDEENGGASVRGNGSKVWLQDDGSRSKGQSGEISSNPHFNTSSNAAPMVPIVVLFHEFAHTYDYASGQLLNEAGHAFKFTENGIRQELGLPERTAY